MSRDRSRGDRVLPGICGLRRCDTKCDIARRRQRHAGLHCRWNCSGVLWCPSQHSGASDVDSRRGSQKRDGSLHHSLLCWYVGGVAVTAFIRTHEVESEVSRPCVKVSIKYNPVTQESGAAAAHLLRPRSIQPTGLHRQVPTWRRIRDLRRKLGELAQNQEQDERACRVTHIPSPYGAATTPRE
jgi:hypothetical protein